MRSATYRWAMTSWSWTLLSSLRDSSSWWMWWRLSTLEITVWGLISSQMKPYLPSFSSTAKATDRPSTWPFTSTTTSLTPRIWIALFSPRSGKKKIPWLPTSLRLLKHLKHLCGLLKMLWGKICSASKTTVFAKIVQNFMISKWADRMYLTGLLHLRQRKMTLLGWMASSIPSMATMNLKINFRLRLRRKIRTKLLMK